MALKPIYIINGPNLNRLGSREPEIYGNTTLAEIEKMCRVEMAGRKMVFRQSNSEQKLIETVHAAIAKASAIVINPAAFSFTSMALLDALKMFPGPIVEVHISNIHRREEIYRHSLMSRAATGVIVGLGPMGYVLAIRSLLRKLEAAG